MSPETRRILWNFLSRRRVFITISVLLHFVGSLFFLQGTFTTPLWNMGHGTFLFFLGSTIWPVMMEVIAKPMRAQLALPLGQQDLWKTYWWMTFAIPAVTSTVISLLALAFVALIGPLGVPLHTVLIWFIGQWGFLALGWCCLCLLPSDAAVARQRPVTSYAASGFWGVQSTFFLYFIPTAPFWSYLVLGVSALTLWAAMAGRQLTGQFILERIGRPDVFIRMSAAGEKSRGKPHGVRGWLTLLAIHGPAVAMMVLIPTAVWILSFLSGWTKSSGIGMIMALLIGSQMSTIMAFMFSRNLISGLRVLRSLPLSAWTISLILMMAAWIPVIIGFGLLMMLSTDTTAHGSIWLTGLTLVLALVSFLPMVNLRFRSPWLAVPAFIVPLVLIVLPGQLAGELSGNHRILVAASILMILVLTLRTWWEVRYGRKAYETCVPALEGLTGT